MAPYGKLLKTAAHTAPDIIKDSAEVTEGTEKVIHAAPSDPKAAADVQIEHESDEIDLAGKAVGTGSDLLKLAPKVATKIATKALGVVGKVLEGGAYLAKAGKQYRGGDVKAAAESMGEGLGDIALGGGCAVAGALIGTATGPAAVVVSPVLAAAGGYICGEIGQEYGKKAGAAAYAYAQGSAASLTVAAQQETPAVESRMAGAMQTSREIGHLLKSAAVTTEGTHYEAGMETAVPTRPQAMNEQMSVRDR